MKKLLLVTILSQLMLVGCSDEADKVAEAAKTAVEATKEVATDAVDATTDAATDAMDATKEVATDAMDATGNAVDATADAASDAMDATKEVATDAMDATKEAATDTMDATKEVATDAMDATKEAVDSSEQEVMKTLDKSVEQLTSEVDALNLSAIEVPAFESESATELANKYKGFVNDMASVVQSNDPVALTNLQQTGLNLDKMSQDMVTTMSAEDATKWSDFVNMINEKLNELLALVTA